MQRPPRGRTASVAGAVPRDDPTAVLHTGAGPTLFTGANGGVSGGSDGGRGSDAAPERSDLDAIAALLTAAGLPAAHVE
jgi:hypothetical protein